MLVSRTGNGGGRRGCLSFRNGVARREEAGRIAAGIEVRAEGEFVVVCPTVDRAGAFLRGGRGEVAELPGWVIAMASGESAGKVAARCEASGREVMRKGIGEVMRVKELARRLRVLGLNPDARRWVEGASVTGLGGSAVAVVCRHVTKLLVDKQRQLDN